MKGEYEIHQAESGFAPDAYDRADAFYRQALARDPNFAEAAAALAHSRLLRHWEISPLALAELDEVKSLIDRALALAPNLPEAHVELGVFFYVAHRQYEMALAEFNRALELQPNNALARAWSALVYRRRGEWERSLADFQRAQELAPRDARIPRNIGQTYLALRLWKDAERAELRALAIDPHDAPAAAYLLSSRLNATGDVDSARRVLDDFPEAIKSLNLVGRGNAASVGLVMLSLKSPFTSTSCKDVSPMLFKRSTRKWPIMIVRISSSLSGALPFACWQGRLRQPNPQEKKRDRRWRPGSASNRTTLWR